MGTRNSVIRTVAITDYNSHHTKITLFDRGAGNLGHLVLLSNDLESMLEQLDPYRIVMSPTTKRLLPGSTLPSDALIVVSTDV